MKIKKCPKYSDPLKILKEDDLKKIHEASIKILEDIGVRFYSNKVLKILKDKDINVDFDSKLVKIKREVVECCLKKVPKAFCLYSQNYDELKIGSDNFFVVSTIDNPYILDPSTNIRREGKLEDVINTVRLIDELPFFHICCNPVVVHDIDPRIALLYACIEVFKNTQKHCLVEPTNGLEAKFVIKLGAAIAGSMKKLCNKPIISTSVSPSSPLKFPENTCEVILEFARNKLPIIIVHGSISGVSSPVTIAGTIAQANAESLAAITLIQLINESSPVIYGGALSNFDMRFGTCAYGASEYGLLSIITAQMARFYNLPSNGACGATNSNITDTQAGYEKMNSTMLAYMAGHDVVCDAGLNSNSITSFESLLLQDEIFSKAVNISKKVEINEETLSLELIKKASNKGDFLSEPLTLKYMNTDFNFSNIGNREIYERWLLKGGLDISKVALERAKKIIKNNNPKLLTEDELDRINAVINLAKEELLSNKS